MGNRIIKTNVNDLQEGMRLGENLYDPYGNILLGEGIILKESYIVKIKTLNISNVYIKEEAKNNNNFKNSHIVNDPYLLETRFEAKKIVGEAMGKLDLDEGLFQKVSTVVSKLITELIENDEIIISLGKLKNVDDYTLEHSINVCILSLVIGMQMGIDYNNLMDLGVGAILHDIGKMLVPQEIINKPGPLTLNEYQIVKKHTIYGYDILKNSNKISEVAAEIALNHHERLDGNGYPFGKKNEQINTYSKIVALCDVYDALTSDRVYKGKIEPHKALEHICKMTNIQFDTNIVKILIECIGIYPIGSLVKLNTSEIGLVVDINKKNAYKPVIRILLDEQGRRVKSYFEVDTSRNPDIEVDNIFLKFDGDLNLTNL